MKPLDITTKIHQNAPEGEAMSREKKAIVSILEFIHQNSEGGCPLCWAKDYPVKGDKRGYEEVLPEEAEEWNIDHDENCPVKILEEKL